MIRPNVYAVGVIDWDRTLFDELIPLPDGTTYNAYLVKGSGETALLDTVDPDLNVALFANLMEVGVETIDYVVAHHADPGQCG
ncbi:MAG: FprA family A-type flavoprotein, partial [Planctomycetes bacterium]|nr:FprA family A-type flavoprotein [Planctomycetota bacterium]